MFQLKSLSVSALFPPLKNFIMLINTNKRIFMCIFRIFELHTHASDFSDSVKRQTLPPYLILIYILLWLCAENCTLVTTNARLSTFWQLTKWTMIDLARFRPNRDFNGAQDDGGGDVSNVQSANGFATCSTCFRLVCYPLAHVMQVCDQVFDLLDWWNLAFSNDSAPAAFLWLVARAR